MRRTSPGFTLVELMVSVAIVAILAAIALPAYTKHIVRGRLTEVYSALGAMQPAAEQFWANSHTFAGMTPLPQNTSNFTYALSSADATSYVVTATGIGKMAGFVFTLDQTGARATTGAPAGWTTNATCWVDGSDGHCPQ